METITQESLYKKYQADLAELQNNCKHEKVSDWMKECLADHGTGYEVKVCKYCNSIIERQGKIFDGGWQLTVSKNG
jgi:hypothetical protein